MKRSLYTLCFTTFIVYCSWQQQVPERDDTLPAVAPNSFSVFPTATDSPIVSNTNIEQQAASQPVATAALNPEHGQPGHRCDIAVGAPLNSPSTKQAAPTATASPVQSISSPADASGSVTLNPPHGQPGHDCAIPVGQPLKG